MGTHLRIQLLSGKRHTNLKLMKTTFRSLVFMVLLLTGGSILFMSSTNTNSHPNASGGVNWIAPAWADTIKNPMKGNLKSVADGKKMYVKNCVVCHGDKGKGDGVAAAGLTPKPADHSSAKIQKQSDGALYWKLSNGRSPMPGYGSLTAVQRWDLVNYVRTLKAEDKPKK
jgi:mono/diheme cytochrome c family protein